MLYKVIETESAEALEAQINALASDGYDVVAALAVSAQAYLAVLKKR